MGRKSSLSGKLRGNNKQLRVSWLMATRRISLLNRCMLSQWTLKQNQPNYATTGGGYCVYLQDVVVKSTAQASGVELLLGKKKLLQVLSSTENMWFILLVLHLRLPQFDFSVWLKGTVSFKVKVDIKELYRCCSLRVFLKPMFVPLNKLQLLKNIYFVGVSMTKDWMTV